MIAREIKVVSYTSDRKREWDAFVRNSKNGLFLFERNYLEYHADRFTDYSQLFFDDGKLIALFPANIDGNTVTSHAGLTFGGVVSDARMKTALMLEIFEALLEELRNGGATTLIYKAIPHIYHRVPSEEDLYALHAMGAQLIRRDISATIFVRNRPPVSKGRKSEIKKGAHLSVRQSEDFETFMRIEEEVLRTRHSKKPVHTAAELQSLAAQFPANIKLFVALKEAAMLGGIVVYESDRVAHAQYISATDEGKQTGAQDVIVEYLINDYYKDKAYFDFGISTEQDGRYLNAGLQQNKESYGGRAIVHDFYRLNLSK
jgi:Acetyltransferase (GNAT) domain